MNKTLTTLAFTALSLFAGSSFAANAACDAQAAEKKLSDAATRRFPQKCDSRSSCT